ncbi:MAG: cupin domain-containing protein [Chloroflexota bacterium]|nr:cupin domain-containing protein [Chloroflexota bacterium]
MRLVRMFTGEDGQSHFEEIDLPAKADAVGETASLLNACGAVTMRRVLPGPDAGWPPARTGGWHKAPRRQYVVVLSGEMEVAVADGETRRFRPGDVLLTEDTTGKGHITRTVGDQSRVMLHIPLEP